MNINYYVLGLTTTENIKICLVVSLLLISICICLNRAKLKSGERVLVHGASGAVGLAAVQIAKAYGRY